MSRCGQVGNPCQRCLGPVTHKTGLQCEGECQSWIHYSCLNFTPGKISDIKAGVIGITCPCQNCKTSLPREIRMDKGFTCNNRKCPANMLQKCENTECPKNNVVIEEDDPTPAFESPLILNKCGKQCKEYSDIFIFQWKYDSAIPDPAMSQNQNSTMLCPYLTHGSYSNSPRTFKNQLVNLLEQMCYAIGDLSLQVMKLMCKMENHGIPNTIPYYNH